MNIDDLQDILAMIAFKLAVEIEDKKSIKSEGDDAVEKIEEVKEEIDLDALADEIEGL